MFSHHNIRVIDTPAVADEEPATTTLPARRIVTTAIPARRGHAIPVGATVAVFEIVTGEPGRVSVRTEDDRHGAATLTLAALTEHTRDERDVAFLARHGVR